MNNHFTIPHTPGINWLSHFEKEYIVGKAEGGRTLSKPNFHLLMKFKWFTMVHTNHLLKLHEFKKLACLLSCLFISINEI